MATEMKWTEIAECMGGRVTPGLDKCERIIRIDGRSLILTDNGGELNVHEIVPVLDFSVPTVWCGPATIANRLLQALDGERINYNFNADNEA